MARRTYSGAGTSTAIYTDVNGDGNGDHIAVNLSSTSISVLFGNTDGSFRASTTYHSGAQPLLVNSSDLNGDGFADLVTSNSGSSTASVLLNNGDGTFKAPTTYANAYRVRLSDFNGDGVTDMVTTSTNTFGIYLGNAGTNAAAPPLDLRTQESARTALITLEGTHTRILSEVGRIGAFRQRLTTAGRSLDTARENFAAAESRIKDADIAKESAELLKNEISQQVAVAIAAQANQAPNLVLSLI